MPAPIASRLDDHAAWRATLAQAMAALGRFLDAHDLLDDAGRARCDAVTARLGSERLTVAFVAEFSRGKSELINAVFFADTGRRVLPATPGRTTMCPVELAWDPALPPRLALLPIETRLRGASLAELRERPDAWQHRPLDPQDPDALAAALEAVTRTQRVPVAAAEALGFWNPEQPDDNPPVDDEGQVEVPAWRHARINVPHPLLARGLVVVDTPGLNAIGAEPELTVGLLPSAHAVVFVLGADTGVTRSDLAIWRDHLGEGRLEPFVVLNKIDALADPLLAPAEVDAQIEAQRQETARQLGVPPARVFALSAREALAGRVAGDDALVARSRLPALEQALAAELMPRQRLLLQQSVRHAAQSLQAAALRRLADQRRQHAEQMLELRGLRGKSGAKVRLMLQRVDEESADFERCVAHITALRAVHARLQRGALESLSAEALRADLDAFVEQARARVLNLGAGKAFGALCERLRHALARTAALSDEMRQMLDAGFLRLNTEFGFAFSLAPAPQFARFDAELDQLEQNYGRYLSLTQAWRFAQPGFLEQFRRLLLSRVRVIFESAAGELELWSRAASAQVEQQLRERRRGFKRRREALDRIQLAAGELERRLAEVEAADERLAVVRRRVEALVGVLIEGGAPAAVNDLPQAAEVEPAHDLPAAAAGEGSSGRGLAQPDHEAPVAAEANAEPVAVAA